MKHEYGSRWAGAAGALMILLLAAGCSSEARRARHLERGERYLAAESYEEAIIEFTNVLHSDPTNAVATRSIGMAYLKIGNLTPAFVYLRRAADLTPHDDDLQLQLGTLYVIGNEPQKGWDIGQEMFTRNPTNFEALLLMVDAARDTNQVQQARQLLDANHERFGDRDSFHLADGSLWARTGNLEKAEKAVLEAVAHNINAPRPHLALGMLYQLRGKDAESVAELKTAAELSPTNSIARVGWAEALFRSGEHAEARRILQELNTQFPTFAPGLVGAAKLALADRDTATCQSIVESLLKQYPSHIEGQILKARLLLVAKKNKDAIALLRDIAKRAPSLAEAHQLLGSALATERDLDGAAMELKAALELRPDMADARLLLCEMQILSGKPEQAVGTLEALVKRPAASPRAFALLSAAYHMQGRAEDATDVLRRLVAAAPDNAQGQLLLGLLLKAQNRPTEATQAFEDALVAAPDYMLPAAQLASIKIQARDVEGAVARLKEQIARAPKAPGLPFLLGTIYVRMGETNLAIGALQQALACTPDFVGAHIELSRLYLAGGRPQDALTQIETALAQHPDNVPALMCAATIQQAAGNLEGARARYEQLLNVSPRYVPAANNLAYLLAGPLNDLEAAFALATKAREWAPKDPYTADTLGWIAYKRGDYPWAVTLLRESLDKLKQQPEVEYHLACALLATGDETEATRLLRESLQASLAFSGRDDAVRMLDLLEISPAKTHTRDELQQMRKTLLESPPTAATLCRLGRIDAQLEGPAAAIQQYEKALKLDAKYLPALVAAAESHQQMGNLDDARKCAMAARDINPQNGDVLHILGQIAYAQGQHAWAYSVLKEAAAKQADHAGIQLDVGLAAFALGRMGEAGTAFQNAIRLDKETGTIGRKAASCNALFPDAIRQVPADRARAQIDAVLQDWPDCLPALAASAAWRLQAGDLGAAEIELARINTQYPTYTPAIASRLSLLANRHDGSAEALKLAALGREQAPGDANLAEAAGQIFYWGGQCNQAASILGQLRGAGRTLSPDSLYGLGLCLLQSGDQSTGTTVLNEAIAAAPDHTLAEDARRALAAQQQQ
ncbi:MAG: tetratricopeptide repeat protein [Lentisphaerae bacterium]|nr:tetratricopeptide repeat protein [Lentisphaerota bacterium]